LRADPAHVGITTPVPGYTGSLFFGGGQGCTGFVHLMGWVRYFALAETPRVFESLDQWLRRRLRMDLWKQWKRPQTRYREFRQLGIPEEPASEVVGSSKGYWRLSATPQLHKPLGLTYWRAQGLVPLKDSYAQVRNSWRTAGCVDQHGLGVRGSGVPPAPTRFFGAVPGRMPERWCVVGTCWPAMRMLVATRMVEEILRRSRHVLAVEEGSLLPLSPRHSRIERGSLPPTYG